MVTINTNILDTLHNHTREELSGTGIYTIKSQLKKKYYIGRATRISSKTKCIGFRERWRDHIRQLLKNNHHNIYLQRHVNKYGIKDLEFKILEYYEPEFCASAELYWIRLLDSVKYGFNISYDDIVLKFGKNSSKYIQLDDEKIIYKYLNSNITIRQLAFENNVSVTKIKSILDLNNINVINKRNTQNIIDYYVLYKEYINGLSIPKLAKKYNINVTTVRNQFKYKNLI